MAKNKPSSGYAKSNGKKLQKQQAAREKREAKQAKRVTSQDPQPWREIDGGEGI